MFKVMKERQMFALGSKLTAENSQNIFFKSFLAISAFSLKKYGSFCDHTDARRIEGG